MFNDEVNIAAPEDLFRIGRFRYETYIDQLGRISLFADHHAKLLIEPLDAAPGTINIFTERFGKITGAARLTIGPFDEDTALPYQKMLQNDSIKTIESRRTIIVSRLMVSENSRGTGNGLALIKKSFEISCKNDIVLGLASCRPSLENLFIRYGFARCGAPYEHIEAGIQLPLAIGVEPDFLKTRKSGLLNICMKYRSSSPWTNNINNALSQQQQA